MSTNENTATQHMIDQLNGAEEVLADLDQHAGQMTPMGQVFLRAYETIKAARDRHARDWNVDINPGEQAIYRCAYADKPYHTDADGPCDVWSLDQVCGLHIQLAEEQMATAAQCSVDRADYFRRKNRGEDV